MDIQSWDLSELIKKNDQLALAAGGYKSTKQTYGTQDGLYTGLSETDNEQEDGFVDAPLPPVVQRDDDLPF